MQANTLYTTRLEKVDEIYGVEGERGKKGK